MGPLPPIRQQVRLTNNGERFKMLLVWGIAILLYASALLFLEWRASRVAETTCTLRPLSGTDGCALVHELDRAYEGPFLKCTKASGWSTPEGMRVKLGATVPCFYYLNDPARIRSSAPPRHQLTPIRAAFVALGLGLSCVGAVGLLLVRRKLSVLADTGRQGTTPVPFGELQHNVPGIPLPTRQEIRRTTGSLGATIFGSLLLALGGFGMWLVIDLAWTSGETLDFAILASAILHIPLVGGTLLVLYRSGVVIDASQGVMYTWWGLLKPWRRHLLVLGDYHSARVSVRTTHKGGPVHSVELAARPPHKRSESFACSGSSDAMPLANAIDEALRPWANCKE